MTTKYNRDLKSRGYTNKSMKRLHIDKNKYLLPNLDFYSIKYAYTVAIKEGRDIVLVFQDSSFKQSRKDDKLLLLKLMGAVALLLVESNEVKWYEYLQYKNRKQIIYKVCNKIIHRTEYYTNTI